MHEDWATDHIVYKMTTTITMTDTGKRRTSSSSAEETDIANSGSAITFFGVELSLAEKAQLNTGSPVGKLSNSADAGSKFTSGEIDHLGIDNPVWNMRFILRDDEATDMALIKHMRDLIRTKGYKTLSGDLPDWTDGTSNSSTVNVRVVGYQALHRSNSNIIECNIQLVETQ